MPNEKLFAQARDELFSHINRCGVLSATDEDKTVWMDETIDYLGERYPELAQPDLTALRSVGIRFCQPAINNVSSQTAVADPPVDIGAEGGADVESITDSGTTAAENTSDEGDDANAA